MTPTLTVDPGAVLFAAVCLAALWIITRGIRH